MRPFFFMPRRGPFLLPSANAHSIPGQRLPDLAVPIGTKFRTPLNLHAFARFPHGNRRRRKNFGTNLTELRFMSGKVRESPMSDIAYLRKLAERYRKLARSFKHAAIRDRLETLADDLEQKVRELQQPLPGMPIIRRYNPVH
jgi:hypothetical protein